MRRRPLHPHSSKGARRARSCTKTRAQISWNVVHQGSLTSIAFRQDGLHRFRAIAVWLSTCERLCNTRCNQVPRRRCGLRASSMRGGRAVSNMRRVCLVETSSVAVLGTPVVVGSVYGTQCCKCPGRLLDSSASRFLLCVLLPKPSFALQGPHLSYNILVLC
jgi:hypothetical protein